jgi:hypothetical protein
MLPVILYLTYVFFLRAVILIISERKKDYSLRRMYVLFRYLSEKLGLPHDMLFQLKPEDVLHCDEGSRDLEVRVTTKFSF